MPIRAITLDLDDTLWPFAPVARRIQAAFDGWMLEHAPATHAVYDEAAAMASAQQVREELPHLAHDVTALRQEVLRRMITAAGEDPALAQDAFAVIFEARQGVELYPDAAPALDRLAARVPLLAVTNGNADIGRTGVAHWFAGAVSAADVGVAKPDPRVFHAACERLGAAPGDVLHVGDDLELDVRGALAAGLHAAWVHRDLDGEAPDGVIRARDLLELADAVDALASA